MNISLKEKIAEEMLRFSPLKTIVRSKEQLKPQKFFYRGSYFALFSNLPLSTTRAGFEKLFTPFQYKLHHDSHQVGHAARTSSRED